MDLFNNKLKHPDIMIYIIVVSISIMEIIVFSKYIKFLEIIYLIFEDPHCWILEKFKSAIVLFWVIMYNKFFCKIFFIEIIDNILFNKRMLLEI